MKAATVIHVRYDKALIVSYVNYRSGFHIIKHDEPMLTCTHKLGHDVRKKQLRL